MNTDKLKKAMALAWNKKEYEIYGILKEIMDEGGFEAISPCPPNMYFKKISVIILLITTMVRIVCHALR